VQTKWRRAERQTDKIARHLPSGKQSAVTARCRQAPLAAQQQLVRIVIHEGPGAATTTTTTTTIQRPSHNYPVVSSFRPSPVTAFSLTSSQELRAAEFGLPIHSLILVLTNSLRSLHPLQFPPSIWPRPAAVQSEPDVSPRTSSLLGFSSCPQSAIPFHLYYLVACCAHVSRVSCLSVSCECPAS
jgi:hypothetical protein